MVKSLKGKLAGFAVAGALALAMAPAAAFGVGALTADSTISVTGTDEDTVSAVTAYKIVQVDQSHVADDGTSGWALVDGITLVQLTDILGTNANGISADEAAKLASEVSGDGIPMTKSGDTWSATVDPGMYVVLVTSSGAMMYNPVIVSADYSQEEPNSNVFPLSADANYTGSTAVLKKSEPTLTKTTVNATDQCFQVGDTIEFQLGTTVPYYPSPYYENASFVITDTIDAGLTYNADTVAIAGLTKGTDYTATVSGQTLTITFLSAFLQGTARGPKPITVTYSAVVSSDPASFTDNVNERTNEAGMTYTNNPGETEESDKVKTHHYTFGLDADLAGTAQGTSKELRKVAVDSKGNAIYEPVAQSQWDTQTPLQGATFTLTGTSTDGIAYSQEFQTDASGHITFTGLDAGVTYTLQETAAPAGYQLDTTAHTVVITPTYVTGTDQLASYTVSIDGAVTATVTVTNDSDGEISSVEYANDSQTFIFKNVKAGVLPATGGSGIFFYIFIGAAIMALAVILARRNRAKNVSLQ